VLDEADAALEFKLSDLIFSGPEETLKLTEHTQPAILTVSTAAARVLAEQGISAAMAAGHSLGEYSAHVAAGTLSFADAVRAVRLRGRYMQHAVPAGEGAMAAILGMDAGLIATICEQVCDQMTPLPKAPGAEEFNLKLACVAAANLNSPGQTVISGAAGAVERAVELCKQAGAKRAVMLPVSAPFHCALMQPAADRLATELARVDVKAPEVPVVSNVEAKPNQDAARVKELLERQVTAPVRWEESVQCLAGLGVDSVVEVGAGNVLGGLVRRIAPELTVHAAGDPASIETLANA